MPKDYSCSATKAPCYNCTTINVKHQLCDLLQFRQWGGVSPGK